MRRFKVKVKIGSVKRGEPSVCDEEEGMNYGEKSIRVYENLYAIQVNPDDDRYRHDIWLIEKALQEAHDAGLEEGAKVAEGGRFLHDDAPDARLGRACAKAIRALKSKGGE